MRGSLMATAMIVAAAAPVSVAAQGAPPLASAVVIRSVTSAAGAEVTGGTVTALVAGVVCDSKPYEPGVTLQIGGADQPSACGASAGTISFQHNGVPAEETAAINPGVPVNIDLTLASQKQTPPTNGVSVTANGPYVPGPNSVVIQGASSPGQAVPAVMASSGLPVQAIWFLSAGNWAFYLPALPDSSTLASLPSVAAAFVVLGNPAAPAPLSCDPSYPGVCIPPPLPDLDCGDIGERNFQVLLPDPHRFDEDGDGVGCES